MQDRRRSDPGIAGHGRPAHRASSCFAHCHEHERSLLCHSLARRSGAYCAARSRTDQCARRPGACGYDRAVRDRQPPRLQTVLLCRCRDDCCRKGCLIARGLTCPRPETGRALSRRLCGTLLECCQLAKASAPIGAHVIDLISHAPADGLILEFSLDFKPDRSRGCCVIAEYRGSRITTWALSQLRQSRA